MIVSLSWSLIRIWTGYFRKTGKKTTERSEAVLKPFSLPCRNTWNLKFKLFVSWHSLSTDCCIATNVKKQKTPSINSFSAFIYSKRSLIPITNLNHNWILLSFMILHDLKSHIKSEFKFNIIYIYWNYLIFFY